MAVKRSERGVGREKKRKEKEQILLARSTLKGKKRIQEN